MAFILFSQRRLVLPPNFGLMIRSVATSMGVVFLTIFFVLVAIVLSFWKKGGDLAHLTGRCWGKAVLFVSRVKVSVEGLEHIDPHATYLYMANHQSMFDILVLSAYLPVQFRWLAKKELFQIPIFGHAMAIAGYISIDRSDRRSAHKSLMVAARKIARGVSVVIFPEGSRSSDGQIGSFKAGGFHLACLSGQPIVPTVICGTHEVMPKGRLSINPGRVVVSISPPVDTVSCGKRDKKRLTESVHAIMKQDLDRRRAGQPRRHSS